MPNFDAERFEGLVLYIAWRTRTDQSFGRVKLAKVLFYSDFEAYAETGDSLTGAIYIRMPFGPFPKALDNAELRLARAQRVRLEHDTEDYEAKRIIPLGEPPDLDDMFKPSQLVAVTKWINKISRASATVASEQSHGHPGWILAKENGVVIPYESVFAPNRQPSDDAVALGRRLAREHPEWT